MRALLTVAVMNVRSSVKTIVWNMCLFDQEVKDEQLHTAVPFKAGKKITDAVQCDQTCERRAPLLASVTLLPLKGNTPEMLLIMLLKTPYRFI